MSNIAIKSIEWKYKIRNLEEAYLREKYLRQICSNRSHNSGSIIKRNNTIKKNHRNRGWNEIIEKITKWEIIESKIYLKI